MNGISRNSNATSSMPQNCGMKGMHENAEVRKQTTAAQLVKAPVANAATKQQAMPENCGMKGMHENGKGSSIDARA